MAGQNHYTDYPLGFGDELVSALPCVVYEAVGSNETGVDLWIAFFDQTTPPVDGQLPFEVLLVKAGSSFSLQFPGPGGVKGRRMANGLAMGWSLQKGFYLTTGGFTVGVGYVSWREV